jgi:hypothetical protein
VLLHHGLAAAAQEGKGWRGGAHHCRICSVEGPSLARGRGEMTLSLLPSWHPFSGDESTTTGKGIQRVSLSFWKEKREREWWHMKGGNMGRIS